jgi:putative membrane protein
MRIFYLLVKATVGVVVFLVLLGFAVKNTDSVVVRYFLGLEWQAPLVFFLLVFFAAGIALGVMASLAVLVRQRREILILKRELRGATRGAVTPLMSEPV